MTDISHIREFLYCDTPSEWVENAVADIDLLLIDHANCELKAAQTAQSLMWKYGMKADSSVTSHKKSTSNPSCGHADNVMLLNKMSRLAREELRHFEQVLAIMKKRNIDYIQIDAARYAAQLRKPIRTSEPGKLVDTLILGAIIEARSCERFARLAPCVDAELGEFYRSLLKSEARHYQDYLQLAEQVCQQDISERIAIFLTLEQELIQQPDSLFRFHSGPVVLAA